MTLDRRHFIAGIAGSAALAGCATSPSGSSAPSVAGLQAAPMPAFIGQSTQKLMPKGKAPRVVICGGGYLIWRDTFADVASTQPHVPAAPHQIEV